MGHNIFDGGQWAACLTVISNGELGPKVSDGARHSDDGARTPAGQHWLRACINYHGTYCQMFVHAMSAKILRNVTPIMRVAVHNFCFHYVTINYIQVHSKASVTKSQVVFLMLSRQVR